MDQTIMSPVCVRLPKPKPKKTRQEFQYLFNEYTLRIYSAILRHWIAINVRRSEVSKIHKGIRLLICEYWQYGSLFDTIAYDQRQRVHDHEATNPNMTRSFVQVVDGQSAQKSYVIGGDAYQTANTIRLLQRIPNHGVTSFHVRFEKVSVLSLNEKSSRGSDDEGNIQAHAQSNDNNNNSDSVSESESKTKSDSEAMSMSMSVSVSESESETDSESANENQAQPRTLDENENADEHSNHNPNDGQRKKKKKKKKKTQKTQKTQKARKKKRIKQKQGTNLNGLHFVGVCSDQYVDFDKYVLQTHLHHCCGLGDDNPLRGWIGWRYFGDGRPPKPWREISRFIGGFGHKDVVTVEINMDERSLTFYKNGQRFSTDQQPDMYLPSMQSSLASSLSSPWSSSTTPMITNNNDPLSYFPCIAMSGGEPGIVDRELYHKCTVFFGNLDSTQLQYVS